MLTGPAVAASVTIGCAVVYHDYETASRITVLLLVPFTFVCASIGAYLGSVRTKEQSRTISEDLRAKLPVGPYLIWDYCVWMVLICCVAVLTLRKQFATPALYIWIACLLTQHFFTAYYRLKSVTPVFDTLYRFISVCSLCAFLF
jgi:hypothetical protein